MNNKSAGFVIDTMLGRLAKWLRVMGLDAHYQSAYKKMEIEHLLKKGRILLTRNRDLSANLKPSILLSSDKVQDQLIEMKKKGFLPMARKNWLQRCIKCNTLLKSVQVKDAQGRIPEYIISQNIEGIHCCPSCNRYFWPGSHRKKMLSQIKEWGLLKKEDYSPPANPNVNSSFDSKKSTCD